MKVLQIFDLTAPMVIGYSIRSRYISESLNKLGVNIVAVSSPIQKYKNQKETINNIEYVRSVFKPDNFFNRVPLLREHKIISTLTRTIVENWDPSINLVNAHSSPLNGVVGAKIARKYHQPFLYEIRALWEDAAVDQGKAKEGDLRYTATRMLETSIVNKADKVTVICEGLKNDLIGRGIPAQKIEVIPNGVDSEEFQPLEKDCALAKKLGLEGCFVVGYIGTFFDFEGIDLLVRSAQKAVKLNKHLRFLIVGGGIQADNLKRLAKELGVEDVVIFTGRVDHNEIKRYYSIIDAFVYPRISKRITELVTPLKPLESMAMEKIVIGSDVGGIKELVTDGKNGFLFKKENVDDLVDKIRYVAGHSASLDPMRKMAREYVIEERNWLKICRKYLDIYKELGVAV